MNITELSKNINLLREYRLLKTKDNFILEQTKHGFEKIILKGKLQEAEATNHNERVYPKWILEREVEEFKKLISENRAMGEADHPDNAVVNLAHVSHIIRELWWEGNEVWGRIELLNGPDPYGTPSGRILEAMVRRGITLGISSRGIGTTRATEDGREEVQSDYQLITWDFVSNPSTKGAFMMKEGVSKTSRILTYTERDQYKYIKLDRTLNRILKG